MKKDANKYNNMKKSTFWILNISYFLLLQFLVTYNKI